VKAWFLDDYTGISRVRLGETPDPVPAPGEVILQLRFAGLNPADAYLAERQYPAKPQFPHILGRDGLGTVSQLGPGVANLPLGARRAILRGDTGINRWGTFAEKVAVPAESLVEVPSDWTDAEAAGATLVYLTAYQALTMWGTLAPHATVLITGASGGVGVAAVQLAAAMGLRVIALSRSAEKSERLRQLGAEATFNPEDPRWRLAAREWLATSRVELAIDNIGGKLLPEVIDLLGELGMVSVVGRLAGPVPNFNTAMLLFRRIRLGGVSVGSYTREEGHQTWDQILSLLKQRNARPLVDSEWPFAQLPQAFERLAKGPMGKVLLRAP
jgi:NADPH2:quinone reductase